MKLRYLLLCFGFLISFAAFAQQTGWPKTVKTSSGTEIKMYEPAPESYTGNLLKIRSAVSILSQGKADPVFGVLWADVTTQATQSGEVAWRSMSVTNIKFPGETDQSELNELQASVENTLPGWNVHVSRSALLSKLSASGKEAALSANLNASPPKIIYRKQPSILVLVDGQPDLQKNTDWGVDQVVNTPFTIISNNGRFYLYGDKRWYTATSITGNWNYLENIPGSLSRIDNEVRANDTSAQVSNSIAEIIISTEPAELVQSEGEPAFSPMEGTDLLYMTNTGNDVFMDIHSQQYYVLISGRWYTSRTLTNNWTYAAPDKLPADFAKIPEGSPKANVLTSVAGTGAAAESVMEARLPQTAKVDRNNANASVAYDGEPRFENIEGTGLKYAVNTPGSVLNEGRKYYYVEKGVWFESYSANGPWKVAVQRPDGVENIPPSYPVYNVKYVYIYDATPDYVYMGYTPGYLGTYIFGPTIVYGTGYRYRPWRGRHYYPRPLTWGFNMRYTPWMGWGFGINIHTGWFFLNIGDYRRGSCWGGWWGPSVYRPPYYRTYNYYNGSYNGHNNVVVNNYYAINRSNNIYRYRRDVVTYERPRYAYNNDRGYRPSGNNNGRNNNTYNNNNGYNNSSRQENRFPGQRPYNAGNRPVTRTYDPGNQRNRQGNVSPDDGRNNRNSPSQPDNQGGQRPSRPDIIPQRGNGNRNDQPDPGGIRRSGNESFPAQPDNQGGQRPSRPDIIPQRRNSNESFPQQQDNQGGQRQPQPDIIPQRGNGNRIDQPNQGTQRNGNGDFPSRTYRGGEQRSASPAEQPQGNTDNNRNRMERPQSIERPERQTDRSNTAPPTEQQRPSREGGGNNGNERSAIRRGGGI